MSETIFKLISLAREFSQQYTVSMYDLLQEIDYAALANEITDQDIYQELSLYPDFVDDWLEYSEGKRCIGWYFRPNGQGKYLVGYLDEKVEGKEKEYEDKIKACAIFIKHELDMILK